MGARTISARVALAVALSIATTGCIFLVDSLPDGATSSCRLSTDASACGACIATACQPELDACCADESCRAILSDADECAQDEYCSALGKDGTSEKGADFVSCIRASCATSCLGIGEAGSGGDGSTCPGCTTACATGDQNACSCRTASASQPGNSVVCPSSRLDNPICCATPGWPNGSTSQCECVSIFCSDDSGFCQCAVGSYVVGAENLSSCFPQLDQICCLDPGTGNCTCGDNTDCGAEVQVDECSSSTMGCPTETALTKHTTTCSGD